MDEFYSLIGRSPVRHIGIFPVRPLVRPPVRHPSSQDYSGGGIVLATNPVKLGIVVAIPNLEWSLPRDRTYLNQRLASLVRWAYKLG